MYKYSLMQKDIPVLSFGVSDSFDKVEILKVLDAERLPFHLQKKNLFSGEFEKWLMHRNMSSSRGNVQNLIKKVSVKNVLQLSLKNNGLSLNDSYWFRPFRKDIGWQDINFFINGYTEYVGNFLLKDEPLDKFYYSPDICTNGCLEKGWKRIGDKDYLFKAGTVPFYQQPINEVLCCEIAKRAFPKLPVVDYHLAQAGERICSACENFVTEDIEFVPASYIYFSEPLKETETVYSHFIKRCLSFGIRDVEKFLSRMISFDYLICNQDRHFGNFGFLRNVDSGLFISPAPIFDNGNSLWFDEPISMIGKGDEYSKPFKNLQEEQINLIKKCGYIKLDNLKGIDIMFEKYMKDKIEPDRIKKITETFEQRIEMLEAKLQEKHREPDEHNIQKCEREER